MPRRQLPAFFYNPVPTPSPEPEEGPPALPDDIPVYLELKRIRDGRIVALVDWEEEERPVQGGVLQVDPDDCIGLSSRFVVVRIEKEVEVDGRLYLTVLVR